MAKQNKPAIRFKGFTDAWEQRKVGDLLIDRNQQAPMSDEYPLMAFIANEGVAPKGERYDRSALVTDTVNKLYKKTEKGDFIYSSNNLETGSIGLNKYGKACISPVYSIFEPTGIADSDFLGRRLVRKDFINAMVKWRQGVIYGQWRIHESDFLKIEITVPSVEEQRKIGTYLDQLDNLITLHQRKYDKLQVLKKAMLEKMFPKNGSSVPEIRFKGFTDAWEQRKVSEVAEICAGGTPSTGIEKYWHPKEIPWLSSGEVHKKYITYTDNKISVEGLNNSSARMIPANSVLIALAGQGKTRGTVAINRISLTTNQSIAAMIFSKEIVPEFVFCNLENRYEEIRRMSSGDGSRGGLNKQIVGEIEIPYTSKEEQAKIGAYFSKLDHLITLHQRKPYSHIQRRCNMLNEAQRTDKFCEYYAKWITVYKKGAIRQVTMDKYLMTQKWLEKLIPDLKICDLNRIAYQQLLNDYAEYHERQTTMDFHHQLKGAVLDAVDEGLIDRDPTRKAIIKGKAPSAKKIKYLNQFELHTLLASLELKDEVNWDYFILLVAKTGMRFSEALALTPKDFDFYHQTLSISKTWDYKGAGGFQPTKNKSSVRKIQIDWQSVIRFSELVKGLPDDQPIFVDGKVYNSTVNDVLSRHCERCNIPVISIHGLRHTHASLLLFTGVSIASVARRLGHSSMTTTQKTYLHIIQELENKDIDLVMRSLSGLN